MHQHTIIIIYMGVTDKMSKSINKSIIALSVMAGLAMGSIATSFAATVPAGVELAEKQVMVRNNGSEPQSLDPT